MYITIWGSISLLGTWNLRVRVLSFRDMLGLLCLPPGCFLILRAADPTPLKRKQDTLSLSAQAYT